MCLTLLRILPDPDAWRVFVLATDINRDSLERAQRAEYGPWSFRGVDEKVRNRYFDATARGNQPVYRFFPEIQQRLKSWLHFDYLNLKDHCYPSLLTQTTAMDFIFCRNVLIYFSNEVTRDVVQNFTVPFLRRLPHGRTGRTQRIDLRDYRSVFAKGTMLYQRAEHREVEAPVALSSRPLAKRPERGTAPPRHPAADRSR